MNINKIAIQKTSPMYDYWRSMQTDDDNSKRLLKSSPSPASSLFRNEPYKWEILYQSIIREIIKGDNESIKGLLVLIRTLSKDEQEKMLLGFEKHCIFDKKLIDKINSLEIANTSSARNPLRFLRILISIFTNPYNLNLRGQKKHLYERTGSLFFSFRNLFSPSN